MPGKIARRKELEKLMEATDFWGNPEKAKGVVSELKTLKAQTGPVEEMLRAIADVRAMQELGAEAGDAETLADADR